MEKQYTQKLQETAGKMGTTDLERKASGIASGLATGSIDMNPASSSYYDNFRSGMANNKASGESMLVGRGSLAGTGGRTGNAQYNTLSGMNLADIMGSLQNQYQNQFSPMARAQLSNTSGQILRQGPARQSQIYSTLQQQGQSLRKQHQMQQDPSVFSQASGVAAPIAGAVIAAMSDERLKDQLSTLDNGPFEVRNCSWYTWKWNENAEKLGLKGFSCGLLAQEVEKEYPDAIIMGYEGYLMINYTRLMEVL